MGKLETQAHVFHMRTPENECTFRFDSRQYADGSRFFHKGVDEVFRGQANNLCKSRLRT